MQIPEDLKGLAARCAEQMQNDLPPEMTGIDAGEVYSLIERIARLEAQNAKLIEAAGWLVRNCTAELYSPWDTALKMARAALQQERQ